METNMISQVAKEHSPIFLTEHVLQMCLRLFYLSMGCVLVSSMSPCWTGMVHYMCAFYQQWYKCRLSTERYKSKDVQNKIRDVHSWVWSWFAWLTNGYEVVGMENIPADGALIVGYHASLPNDSVFLAGEHWARYRKTIRTCVDRFLFKIPLFSDLMDVYDCIPGDINDMIADLKKGDICAVYPGGVREAFFADSETYNMLWGKRLGFAKIAVLSQRPVVPMFTMNSRDSYRPLRIGRGFTRWLYEKTRLPLVPVFGIFPVKQVTYLGTPIKFSSDTPFEEAAKQIQEAVGKLRDEHQQLPGSILRGLKQRFQKFDTNLKNS